MIALYNSKCHRSIVASIFLFHLALWLLMYHSVEEDAFIYLRFAQNIADGYGYVFNIGGERIESGTSPIWLLLLVASIKMHIPSILAMKLLGLIFSLLMIFVTGRIVFILTRSNGAQLLAMASLAMSYPLVYWAGQGLETPLIGFLFSFYVLCMLDPRWRKGLSPTSIALVLARPEGVVYLSLVIGWGLWSRYCGDRAAMRQTLSTITLALLSLFFITVLRVWYFGDFVAHPFYFKSSNIGGVALFYSPLDAVYKLGIYFLLLPIAAAIFLRWASIDVWLPVFALALQAIWYASVADHFPFERHLVPALPFFYALFAIGWSGLIGKSNSTTRQILFGVALILPVLAGIQYKKNPVREFVGFFIQEPIAVSKAIANRIVNPDEVAEDIVDHFLHGRLDIISGGHNWEAVPGRFIAAVYPKNSVIAFHEMGQSSYWAGQDKVFIDTQGLTTRNVGFYQFGLSFESRPFTHEYWNIRCAILTKLKRESCPSLTKESVVAYILDQHPDVVIIHAFIAYVYGAKFPPAMLLHDAAFNKLYTKKYTVDGAFDVYERNERSFPLFYGEIPGVNVRRLF